MSEGGCGGKECSRQWLWERWKEERGGGASNGMSHPASGYILCSGGDVRVSMQKTVSSANRDVKGSFES